MLDAIKTRRSIRRYLDKDVDEKTVSELIESACAAPSGSNTQPWHFIIVRDKNVKDQLVEVSNRQKWMNEAPVFIVCVADIRSRLTGRNIDIDESSPEENVKQIIRDTAIAVEHIVLEAASRGLGTCWVAWYEQKQIRPILGIPSDKYVVCILTLGHPAETPKPRPKKSPEEIIHHDRW
jgi:nitroreductase